MDNNEEANRILDNISKYIETTKQNIKDFDSIKGHFRSINYEIKKLYEIFPSKDAYRKPLDDMYESFIYMITQYYNHEILKIVPEVDEDN